MPVHFWGFWRSVAIGWQICCFAAVGWPPVGAIQTSGLTNRLTTRDTGDCHSALLFHATRNPGASQGFTDLAAAVQLRLRVAIGLQTLTVKSRLLTGENTVRIRGGPPICRS